MFLLIRGDVITRLKKLDEGEYRGLFLAAAGLKLLGLEKRIIKYFSIEEILPFPCQGILFEVVPGITSAIGVPMYGGIPITHRNYASSFHVMTGHYKEGDTSSINFKALVKLEGTLVFLMGSFFIILYLPRFN